MDYGLYASLVCPVPPVPIWAFLTIPCGGRWIPWLGKIGLNTILNTVLNRHGQVVEAFFGDVEAAFGAGVKRAFVEVYAVELPREADVVLASSHPCDLEFWQAHKTQYPSDLAVRAGGIIIIVSPCHEGVAQTHCDILDITCHSSSRVRDMVASGRLDDEVAAALAIA